MRLRNFIFLILSSLLLASFSYANAVFQDTKGHLVDTKSLKNKWVIVNYWAEWCGPCVREIPELNSFYKNNHNKNVVLYGVYYDTLSINDLKRVVQNANINFPVLANDPNADWQLGEVSILPTTFIMNPKGDVVKTIYGGSNEDSLNAILSDLQQNFASKK